MGLEGFLADITNIECCIKQRLDFNGRTSRDAEETRKLKV